MEPSQFYFGESSSADVGADPDEVVDVVADEDVSLRDRVRHTRGRSKPLRRVTQEVRRRVRRQGQGREGEKLLE